jgi:hypothetical protein
VEHIGELQAIGRKVAARKVEPKHFDGFAE